MCAICGIIVFNDSNTNLGTLVRRMLGRQQIRAQDSAGIAVFQTRPRENVLVQTLELQEQLLENKYAFLKKHVAPHELGRELQHINDNPNQYFIGMGYFMTLVKDLGLAEDVIHRYGIENLLGSHAVAHLRIATSSSDTTPVNAHPFSTQSMPDIAIVHNGEITNYSKLRSNLAIKGHRFESQCDSELIAVLLADRLSKHGDFERANYEFVEKADGPFTYIVATNDAIAMVRDKYGLRKGMIGYFDGDDKNPPFIAMATDVSALNAVQATKNIHAPKHGIPEIYRKNDRTLKW